MRVTSGGRIEGDTEYCLLISICASYIVLDTHAISSSPLLVVGSTEPRATNGRILDPFERKFIEKNQLYSANTNLREANDIENKENRSTTRILFRQNFEPRAGRKKQYVPTAAKHHHQDIRIVRIEQKVHQMQYLPPPPPLNAAAAAVRRHAIRI